MLAELLEATHKRIPAVAAQRDALAAAAAAHTPARGFAAALARPGLQIIAEIKRRSPSVGAISADLDPGELARSYSAGGAAALSVLTEPEYFGGSLDDLRVARAAVDIPVLRKDFIVHEAQLWESRAAEADAVLLVVAALGQARLGELLEVAGDAGLEALVEAHTGEEVRIAIGVGARIIGVNNRDLSTFVTDLAVAEQLVASLQTSDVLKIAESGVSSADGARRMAIAGYDAILVGEAAVRAPDRVAFLGSLREAGR
jgi:indole-3-glycerol phosphate synthase